VGIATVRTSFPGYFLGATCGQAYRSKGRPMLRAVTWKQKQDQFVAALCGRDPPSWHRRLNQCWHRAQIQIKHVEVRGTRDLRREGVQDPTPMEVLTQQLNLSC
jgi:hypothetical protein